jgi:Fur family peroxide stress response transcriptional regulator
MRQPRNAISGDVVQLLNDICRQAGLKMTRQRAEVLRELAHSGDEATVDKMHRRLRSRLPTLSRETVRRTLGALERFGVVHEIDGREEATRLSARGSSGRASLERRRAALRVSSRRR